MRMQSLVVRRKALLLAAQVAVAAVIAWFVFQALSGQWAAIRAEAASIEIRWPSLIASGAVFLVAHAVLVQTWRYVLAAWSSPLSFVEAARIWTVSSIARYLPLKLWQIGAMALMAQRAGVSPVAATGSAVLGTVVNLAAGALVLLFTSAVFADAVVPGAGSAAWVLLIVTVLLSLSLPFAVRLGARLLVRVTGSESSLGALPARALVVAALGNLVAWGLYGVAFQLLARAVFGEAPGGVDSYIAVYTLSYLAGYLVLVAPAGVGVRESAMILAMPAAGLATAPAAALLAVISRLWLTLLELLPGTLFLLQDAVRRRSKATLPDG
jgi:glycosyltransferase 2 family protein